MSRAHRVVPPAWPSMTLVMLFAVHMCGCNVVGPMSLSGGRAVYAAVINTTEDEQLLNVIVRQRYDQSAGMLSVASLTANLRASPRSKSRTRWCGSTPAPSIL